jgi:hypothetical protein
MEPDLDTGFFIIEAYTSTSGWRVGVPVSLAGIAGSELVNEKRGMSPEMAVRLSRVFGGGVYLRERGAGASGTKRHIEASIAW